MPTIKGNLTKFSVENAGRVDLNAEPEIVERWGWGADSAALAKKVEAEKKAERQKKMVKKLSLKPPQKQKPDGVMIPCKLCYRSGFNTIAWGQGFRTRCAECNGVGWLPMEVVKISQEDTIEIKPDSSILDAIKELGDGLADIVKGQADGGKAIEKLRLILTILGSRVVALEKSTIPDGMVLVSRKELDNMVERDNLNSGTVRVPRKQLDNMVIERDNLKYKLKDTETDMETLKRLAKDPVSINIDAEAMYDMSNRIQASIQKEVDKRLIKEGMIKPEPPRRPTGRRKIELQDD